MHSKTEAVTKVLIKTPGPNGFAAESYQTENPFLLKVFQEGEGILLNAHHRASGINTKANQDTATKHDRTKSTI